MEEGGEPAQHLPETAAAAYNARSPIRVGSTGTVFSLMEREQEEIRSRKKQEPPQRSSPARISRFCTSDMGLGLNTESISVSCGLPLVSIKQPGGASSSRRGKLKKPQRRQQQLLLRELGSYKAPPPERTRQRKKQSAGHSVTLLDNSLDEDLPGRVEAARRRRATLAPVRVAASEMGEAPTLKRLSSRSASRLENAVVGDVDSVSAAVTQSSAKPSIGSKPTEVSNLLFRILADRRRESGEACVLSTSAVSSRMPEAVPGNHRPVKELSPICVEELRRCLLADRASKRVQLSSPTASDIYKLPEIKSPGMEQKGLPRLRHLQRELEPSSPKKPEQLGNSGSENEASMGPDCHRAFVDKHLQQARLIQKALLQHPTLKPSSRVLPFFKSDTEEDLEPCEKTTAGKSMKRQDGAAKPFTDHTKCSPRKDTVVTSVLCSRRLWTTTKCRAASIL